MSARSVIRVGFDMDGVLADFSTAFRQVEKSLFGAASKVAAEAPEVEAQQEDATARARAWQRRPAAGGRRSGRRFTTHPTSGPRLKPHDPGAVRRIHDMMMRHGLEVFFITQRPSTLGQTVQRQTQFWLRQQGFDLPSVLVIGGSRGAAAGALRLDYHVDDSPQNCLDIVSDSRARPILIVPEPDPVTENSAKRLRIGVARSIGQALDILEHALSKRASEAPGLLDRLSRIVGRK